ncbi:DEAD/DEAH box helicase [Myxococcus virescens]|uniref:ATP-dependent helicase n=1 Tax=Myxococcus virescens TaxID=83456 RepID=A0A511H7C1_9BACT|nr:DEAD/DEAH box helicase [Myxococcus virescens]GEL68669.1 ATP-dependent helicase [Myxococcus virescens]SDE49823.1 Helicase conserved C-terminal domain-containing protein [Myxococcus virescens]
MGDGHFAVHCVGVSDLVRQHEAIFLTQLDRDIQPVRVEDTTLVQDPSPHYRRSRLYLESLLRQMTPTDALLWRGHRAAMQPSPYQLEPASRALSSLRPRILIADAVGLGKTLEAGILLSELIARGRGERILVVAMKSVLAQFQKELWTRFSIPLMRLDSEGLERIRQRIPAGKNPFHHYRRAIISIDTLKNEREYRHWLEGCQWDAVVVDECHNAINQGTGRNRVAELLASHTEALILTSATPHNGRPESFATLMNMLEPTAVANPSKYGPEDIRGLYVRRFRKDVEQQAQSAFKQRDTQLSWADASPEEEAVFAALQEARFHTLDRHIRLSKKGGARDVLFRTTLLKAFLSSPVAFLETVEQRQKSLRERIDSKPELASDWRKDLDTLDRLHALASRIELPGFSKLRLFLEHTLPALGIRGKPGDPRLVIFSERLATLGLLETVLSQRLGVQSNPGAPGDGTLAVLTGAEKDTDIRAILESFGSKDGKVRVLLASDMASEGINLHHFCSRLIHFDVPWSLIRLEQRNGRIDRYGQTETPRIRFLLTRSQAPQVKADLQVVQKLLDKEQEARGNLGDEGALLGLFDAEREADFVASTISSGKGLDEEVRALQSERAGAEAEDALSENWLLDLLAHSTEPPSTPQRTATPPSLYPSDAAFFREALEHLEPELTASGHKLQLTWHPQRDEVTFRAPEDLQRRFDSMPSGARPREGKLHLSADPRTVERAIDESRDRQGSWPELQYLWSQHPAVEWAADRVSLSFGRLEAPLLVIPSIRERLGVDAVALVEGTLTNRRAQPALTRWLGLCTALGKVPAVPQILALDEVLELAGLRGKVANPGVPTQLLSALEAARPLWRETAEAEMRRLRSERMNAMRDEVHEAEARSSRWASSRLEAIEEARQRLGAHGDSGLARRRRERLDREEAQVMERKKERHTWIQQTLATDDRAHVKLIAVLVAR